MRSSAFGSRRTVHMVATVGVLSALLLGCSTGGGADPQPTGSESDLVAGAVVDPESLSGTVTVWGWSTGPEYADNVIPAFNEVYPNVTVEMKTMPYGEYAALLRPALSSSSGPDVFQLEPGALTEQFGRFAADLEPLLPAVLGEDWESMLATGATDAFRTEDKLAALPVGLSAAGTLVYNETMFNEYNLEPPQTFDEWVEVCQVLASHDKVCLAQGAMDTWVNQDVMQAVSNSIAPGKFAAAVRGEIEWTDPDLVEAFGVFATMFENGIMPDDALAMPMGPDANQRFLRGDAGMSPSGTWGMLWYKADYLEQMSTAAGAEDPTPFTALLMDFPSVTGAATEPNLFGGVADGMAVSTGSDNQAAAAAFVQWLTLSEAGQQRVATPLSQLPVLKGVVPDLTGLVNNELQTASFAQYSEIVQQTSESRGIPYPDLLSTLGNALQAVALGDMTPEDAAQLMQTESASTDRE